MLIVCQQNKEQLLPHRLCLQAPHFWLNYSVRFTLSISTPSSNAFIVKIINTGSDKEDQNDGL